MHVIGSIRLDPSPEVYFWPYLLFEAVGYGEIQRDTAGYS